MARCFAKVLEEEIEEAFFLSGSVKSGGYIHIYPPLFTFPSGDSCFSIYQIR